MNDILKLNQAKQYESWRLMSAIDRKNYLSIASKNLAGISSDAIKAQRLFDYILSQAEHLDEVTRLTGTTGETNDLYFSPRGKVMIVGTKNADSVPVLAQLVAALLAGNEVILRYQSNEELCEQALVILQESGVFSGVISVANDSELTTLLHINRLAVVGVVGTINEALEIGNYLSQSDGIITQLVSVTDIKGCREMFEPEFIERFTTERVKTVNTTAIGGNASLLELGTE